MVQSDLSAIRTWDSREDLPGSFAGFWAERIRRSPHAHFGVDLDYLSWDAQGARHARAFLVDEPDLRGAWVMRWNGHEWVSGWPWRWQAVVETEWERGPVGITAEETLLIYRRAESVVEDGRLRFYAPHPAPSAVPSFVAGETLIQPLAHDDDTILASLNRSRRQAIRRARSNGFEVIEPSTDEHLARWMELAEEGRRRHGLAVAPARALPVSEESRLAALQPGRWLLLGARDGRIESGIHLGTSSGKMIEARASATSQVGRQLGVFPLVMFEAVRRARDRGYLWCNLGGNTFFKRGMAGNLATLVRTYCWLGGRGRWMLVNRGEAWLRRARTTGGGFARGAGITGVRNYGRARS